MKGGNEWRKECKKKGRSEEMVNGMRGRRGEREARRERNGDGWEGGREVTRKN